MEGAKKMGSLLKVTTNDTLREGINKKEFARKATFSIFVLLISLVMVIPFYFMISISLKFNSDISLEPLKFIIPGRINWANYKTLLWDYPNFKLWYMNSLYVVSMVILLRCFIVTMAAYAFARLDFRGKNGIFMMIMSAMMIPGDTTIVAKYILYRYMHLQNTHWVLILPAIADVTFVFLMRQFFMGIPKELSEAALLDGCSHFKIYYRIILPLAKPALLTLVLFTFIWVWNDFVNPYLYITTVKKQLLTAGLQFFQSEFVANISMQTAGACLGIIPAVFLFSIFQKYFVQSIASTGVKG